MNKQESHPREDVLEDEVISSVPELRSGLIRPEGITEEESDALKKRAEELVRQIETTSGSMEMEAVDSISNLGVQAQRGAALGINLLRTRVGDMITRKSSADSVAKDMVELRQNLDQINPHELETRGFLSKLPLVRHAGFLVKALEKVAIRYEPVSKQITVIETRLREGRAMLGKDNIELRKLYVQVEAQQLPVQKNAYLGELLMEELQSLLERTDDPMKQDRIRNSLHDVSMRVQDLRTMGEVHIQFFVSLEMTRQNNTHLGHAVERTLSLATNVVTVGLAIQAALARQRRVLEANQRTQDFLGNVLVANAAAIKRHTTDIGDVYNNPVIAMDKITQAHNDLVAAIEAADQLKQQGIEIAKENIAKLSTLASEMQQRASGLLQSGTSSVEA